MERRGEIEPEKKRRCTAIEKSKEGIEYSPNR
jgi:hypothetical protein